MDDLVIKYLQGECNEHEARTVEEWKNASEQNLNEFLQLKKVYDSGNYLRSYYTQIDVERELEKNLRSIESRESIQEAGVSKQRNFIPALLRYAAVAILCMGLGAYISWEQVSKSAAIINPELVHQVIAPKGSNSIVVLPDGSKVWLNAGSRITYAGSYGFGSRDVTLEGEAYFKVITNPSKPFVVSTSELKIKAYGTSFNVKAYPDEKHITTTLEEGKVTVTGNGVDVVMQPRQNLKYEKRKTDSGSDMKENVEKQKETVSKEPAAAPNVTTFENVNVEMYTSWKDNRWIIESENLLEIKVLLERKFNVDVELKSDELLRYKFRGIFTNETLEQILDVFRYTAPISYKIEKGVVSIDLDKNRKHKYFEMSTQE